MVNRDLAGAGKKLARHALQIQVIVESQYVLGQVILVIYISLMEPQALMNFKVLLNIATQVVF